MSAAIRLLTIGALAMGLSPALARACDESDAKSTVTVTATSTATATATADVKCVVKINTACKVKNAYQYEFVCDESKTNTAVAEPSKDEEDSRAINTEGRRPSGWEPGHLIEPDSMKLQQENQNPQAEQWVKISSRGNKIKFHRTQSSKKTQSRILQQYGPYRVVLNPQLP